MLTHAAAFALAAGLAAPFAAADEANDTMTQAQAQELMNEFRAERPDLFVGDDAPDLDVMHWVQGDPVNEFKEGHVYVVEMWATWCGPCITAIPHLHELSEKYKGDVTFIGMNIFESGPGMNDPEARKTAIEEFVESQPKMTYTVAIEEGSAVADTWMRPAEQNGIPAAFIVDQTGTIAWIGHPMAMDQPLEEIVRGDLSAEEAAQQALNSQRGQAAAQQMMMSFQQGDIDRGLALAQAMTLTVYEDQPEFHAMMAGFVAQMTDDKDALRTAERMARKAVEAAGDDANFAALNAFAFINWKLGNPQKARKLHERAFAAAENDPNTPDMNQIRNEAAWSLIQGDEISPEATDFAIKIAKKATEETDWQNASIIDTYARAVYLKGDKPKAVELQKRAIDVEPDPGLRRFYEQTLAQYEAELAG